MSGRSTILQKCSNLLAIGRFELAREMALGGLVGEEDDGDLLTVAARCTLELEGWEASEPMFRRAANTKPSFENRAFAAHAIGQNGGVEEATSLFEALLVENPVSIAVRGRFADTLMSQESFPDDLDRQLRVEQLVAEQLRLGPDLAPVHFAQARLALIQRKWAKAEVAIKRGLALDPQSAIGLRFLGIVQVAQGAEPNEADESFRRAIRADPGDKHNVEMLNFIKARRAERLAVNASWFGLIGFLLILLGKLTGARGVEFGGLLVVVAWCVVALVCLVVAKFATRAD